MLLTYVNQLHKLISHLTRVSTQLSLQVGVSSQRSLHSISLQFAHTRSSTLRRTCLPIRSTETSPPSGKASASSSSSSQTPPSASTTSPHPDSSSAGPGAGAPSGSPRFGVNVPQKGSGGSPKECRYRNYDDTVFSHSDLNVFYRACLLGRA